MASAEDVLLDADYDILKGGIIVAKSSAYLWAPTNMGGYGLYDQLVARAQPHNVQMAARWKNVLIGDVSGLSGYFTCLGAGAALGWGVPGANVAILGGAALSAAWSSGTAALF